MKTYRLTSAAADDTKTIYVDGLLQFGIDQADSYHEGLFAAFEFLSRYPKSARIREEVGHDIRVHRYRSHLIVYRKEVGHTVLIVRVRHGRQDWQADLAQ